MFSEDELLPISALQHLLFCERQWGLIHLEGIWEENRLTAEGRVLHERVHERDSESRGDVRIARGLALRSLRLGLVGKADVVEFHRMASTVEPATDTAGLPEGVALAGVDGLWRPVPVEYKRGRPKKDQCDEVQLCAQALCIEEMLGASVSEGALFYGKPRRRYEVCLDNALRARTEALASRLHTLTAAGQTPRARYEKKCDRCSLIEHCAPKTTGTRRSAQRYLADLFEGLDTEEEFPT